MRIMAVAAICLWIVGISTGADADAAIRKQTNIPAQGLGPALQVLAKDRNLQVVYRSEVVGKLRTGGAVGELTTEEAVTQLLKGTGLTYRFLEDKAITIVPVGSIPDAATAPSSSTTPPSFSPSTSDQRPPVDKKSVWDDVRLAQANQGTPQRSSTVESDAQSPSASSGNSPPLEEILVTAQKKNENLMDVPVPVTAVSAQALINYNQLRVQDFYNTIPALSYSPQGSQAEDTLSIRGISTGPGTNPTVGITVDDVPFGSPLNQGNGNEVPDIDPNDLARIEVLRGPQGTLYGASSMGGLLKFVTKDPSVDSFSGNVAAGASSVHNGAQPGFNFRASANIPLSDTLAMRVSAFTRQDPGYIDDPFLGINGINEEHSSGGRIVALWKPSDLLSLKISGLYQVLKSDGSFDVNRGPGYTNSGAVPVYTKVLGDLQQSYFPGIAGFRGLGGFERPLQAYSAILNAKFGSVDLTSVTGFNVNTNRDTWDFSPQFGGLTQKNFGVFGTPILDDVTTRKYTQEVRLSDSIGQHIDWLVGGFYEHSHTAYTENIFAEAATGEVVGTWADWSLPVTYKEYAGFADLTYHFTDQFDVQLGARESHIDAINNTATKTGKFTTLFHGQVVTPESVATANVFTYLVTPEFKVSSDLMVYARLASGYRPGQTNGQVIPGLPVQSNPDKTQNYELGLKGEFLEHKLSVDTSIYYINWKDIQEFVTDPNSHFGYTGNAGGAKSEGVEISVALRPLTGLIISAWLAYDNAVLTESFPKGSNGYGLPGTRLPFSTRWSGNMSVQQDFPLSSSVTGFVGGQVSIVGDRLGVFAASATDPRQYYPQYVQTNVRAGAKYESWTANLYVNNATDRRGLVGGGIGEFPPIGFQYITPRTVGLNLAKAF